MKSTRTQTVDLIDLVRDERLRFRDYMHEATGVVQRYSESMTEYGGWGEFPPATVVELTEPHMFTVEVDNAKYKGGRGTESRVYPAGSLILVGGFTRCRAIEAARYAEGCPDTFDPRVPCKVTAGTWADCLSLAWRENAHHGRPRSTDEIASVLQSIHLDPKHREAGEREVAALAGCSRATVNRWRAKRRESEAKASTAAPKVNPVQDTPHVPPAAAYQPEETEGEEEATPSHSATASAPMLKDEWGRPVPPHVAPLWECLPVVKRASRDIRAACLSLGAAKHGPDGAAECLTPGLALLDVRSIVAAGYTAADLIDSQAPFLVCPQCDGHGDYKGKRCKCCNANGALTRPQADTLTPALETKAKSFRGGAA